MGPGWLWPDVDRAPCKTIKTVDFRTSILYVVDEEDCLKYGCVVERRIGNPLAGVGTVRAERGAKAQLKERWRLVQAFLVCSVGERERKRGVENGCRRQGDGKSAPRVRHPPEHLLPD